MPFQEFHYYCCGLLPSDGLGIVDVFTSHFLVMDVIPGSDIPLSTALSHYLKLICVVIILLHKSLIEQTP
jgi:hypothetical protein